MEEFLKFLEDYTEELGSAAAIFALIAGVIAFGRWIKNRRREPTKPAEPKPIEPPMVVEEKTRLTLEEFVSLRRELKDELVDGLSQAHEDEKSQLLARIAALEEQLAEPEKALEEERIRIKELEDLLERSGNQIGSDRINEAREALERGDYSIADDLFAEIEAARELEVKEAARAAFGRGEIAEAEIRWADAAKHYARAARLDESYENLFRARKFAWLSGNLEASLYLGGQLLEAADRSEKPERRAQALNELGTAVRALGRFDEAEALYKRAVEIDKATIGDRHPEYGTHLSNLANVVKDQGRFEEAEVLYNEAIEIDKATIGERHRDHAIRLSNLANVVRVQRRLEEAEALLIEAIAIGEATVGNKHPEQAIRLNNLALVVQAQGRLQEAEGLYRQAKEITKNSVGADHPSYATRLNNLAGVVEDQGRFEEAEALYKEALEVLETKLGNEHPNTIQGRKNLEVLREQMDEEG